MEAASGTFNCLSNRIACRSLASFDSYRLHRSQAGQSRQLFKISRSLYNGLLILVLIICLSPVSVLAHPTTIASDLATNSRRSASDPSGEITAADLHERSSLSELRLDTPLYEGDNSPATEDVSKDDKYGLFLRRRIVTASSDKTTQMPTPFDTMANNFANASCVTFFDQFLANSTVTNCHAVSLLLQNSNSFFHVLTSAAGTSRVLDTTCSEPVAECASIMTSLATEMLHEDNCGADYNSGNSVVQSTYAELLAYEPVYRVTCLTNPDTHDYCFVDAVTNSTAPNDYNVYFIPIGSQLGSEKLTCNECLQATMNIYAQWATVDGQALDNTYLPSAAAVNKQCGANFANTSVTVGSDNVTAGAGLAIPLPNTGFVVTIFGILLGAMSTGIL